MPLPPATRRLFVALRPDPATLDRLAAAAADLCAALGPAGRDLRPVPPGALHLTLRFLGDVEAARLDDVAAAVAGAAAAAPPLALEVRGAGALPDPRRPRVLFLDVGGEVGPLAALAADLEARLRAADFPPEPRPFRPHLTVARVRPGRRPAGLAAALRAAALAPVAWQAREVTLVESHLEAGGARHVPLRAAPLLGG